MRRKTILTKSTLMGCLLFLTLSSNLHALRIVTWNMEHLVSESGFKDWRKSCDEDPSADRVDIPYCNALNGKSFPCGIPESQSLHTQDDYNLKIDLLAKTESLIDGDIYALQEVMGVDALKRVFPEDKFKLYATNSGISQEVAFAVKKEFVEYITGDAVQHDDLSVTDENGRITRPGIELTLQLNEKVISLLNVHLKSGCAWFSVDKFPEPTKAFCEVYPEGESAESMLVSKINARARGCTLLRQQIPIIEHWIEGKASNGQEVIVLGDFNRNFPRDRSFKGRIDGDPTADNTCSPSGCKGKIGSITHEISDNDPTGASIWVLPEKFPQNKKKIIEDGKFRCHSYDYFMLSQSLKDEQRGIQGDDWEATIWEYTEVPEYTIDSVRPSDHCAVSLDLKL